MTVAALESAGGASSAGAAGSASRSRARQRRPSDAEMGRGGSSRGGQARTGARGSRGAEGSTGPRGATGATAPAPARSAADRPERKRTERPERSRRRETARRVTGAATRPGAAVHNYQAIIAAEYVAATLLVAISPIATRKSQASGTSGKLSPYLPADIIKIFAIGMVYLILEGLAAGPRGLARFSAWFGALIFLGVGLSELNNIAQIFKTISGGGYNPTKLTGAAAPATKGTVPTPLLGQGVTGGGQQPAAAEGSGGSPLGSTQPAAAEGSGGSPLGSSSRTFAGGT